MGGKSYWLLDECWELYWSSEYGRGPEEGGGLYPSRGGGPPINDKTYASDNLKQLGTTYEA